MKYYSMKIKGREYKLRLTANAIINIEKETGKSFAEIFAGNGMPSFSSIMTIFENTLRGGDKNLDITTDEVYNLYDDYIDEGKTMTDFFAVIIGAVTESGLFKEEEKTGEI